MYSVTYKKVVKNPNKPGTYTTRSYTRKFKTLDEIVKYNLTIDQNNKNSRKHGITNYNINNDLTPKQVAIYRKKYSHCHTKELKRLFAAVAMAKIPTSYFTSTPSYPTLTLNNHDQNYTIHKVKFDYNTNENGEIISTYYHLYPNQMSSIVSPPKWQIMTTAFGSTDED